MWTCFSRAQERLFRKAEPVTSVCVCGCAVAPQETAPLEHSVPLLLDACHSQGVATMHGCRELTSRDCRRSASFFSCAVNINTRSRGRRRKKAFLFCSSHVFSQRMCVFVRMQVQDSPCSHMCTLLTVKGIVLHVFGSILSRLILSFRRFILCARTVELFANCKTLRKIRMKFVCVLALLFVAAVYAEEQSDADKIGRER